MTARCPVGHMQGSVDRYVQHGILTSRFLTALFSNDLKGAFKYADEHNAAAMHRWAWFMANDMPSCAHGSSEKVSAWIGKHDAARVGAAA